MPTTAIVLDKSFLQGTSKSKIHQLASNHRLIVTSELFYELLTTSVDDRIKCFAKFLPEENPVDLVDHIGKLFRIEVETLQPAGKPSSHRESVRFQFNPNLLVPDYILPDEALQAIREHASDLKSDVDSFIERASTISLTFPNLLVGSDAKRKQTRQDVEKTIANPKGLMPFYSDLTAPPDAPPFPPAELITENWAIYRWLQVQLLFAVDLYIRYNGNIPTTFSDKIFERLEHDVLDAQVLILGCLEGGFASREKKLIGWWRLLCPQGILYEKI